MFIRGMTVVGWCLLMGLLWMCAGHILLLHTGRAPNKYKDDDLGGRHASKGGLLDFAPNLLPTEAIMHPAAGRYPKRIPTMYTVVIFCLTGLGCWVLLYSFFNHTPVVAWFDSRAREFERKGHSNVRRAREIAHLLCPELVLNMHKAKFEEWVRKLAANQVCVCVCVCVCMCVFVCVCGAVIRNHIRTHTHTHDRCRNWSSNRKCVEINRSTRERSKRSISNCSGELQNRKASSIMKRSCPVRDPHPPPLIPHSSPLTPHPSPLSPDPSPKPQTLLPQP
jgi:hypothetical protein